MIRLAEARDAAKLRNFRCLDDDQEDEDGVEHFFREEAWGWSQDPLGDGHYLLVMEDEDGHLIGAAAHHGIMDPFGRYVVAIAITTLRHDAKHGRDLLAGTLRHCSELSPGAVATWLVRRSNEPSVSMCEAIPGANWTEEPGSDGQMLRFRFPL